MDRAEAPQRGVALFVVLVMLMLCTLAVLGACRALLVNESLVGAAADSSRAFAAAEALLRDAEADVLGVFPQGRAASPGVAFPFAPGDMDRLEDAVGSDPAMPCRHGICTPATPETLTVARLKASMERVGGTPGFATYGQFTGAATEAGNPYLGGDARYWVEVFDYPVTDGIAAGASPDQPGPDRPYVFRITAIVQGRRPGTQAVLREVFVPSPMAPDR